VVHTQIKQLPHLEIPPDTQIIIKINLANRHPFKVRAYRVHLARIHADSTGFQKRRFGVVHARRAVSVPIVADLVIIPSSYPCKILVRKLQIGIRPVLPDSRAVVVEGDDFAARGGGARVATGCAAAGLVDVVAEVDLMSLESTVDKANVLTK
jgi:hypothetical protein